MKTIAAAMLAAALGAANVHAEPAPLAHDPLTDAIMSKQLTLPDGGVTGAVRIGSGQAISLSLASPLESTATLKDAVADTASLAPLKPEAGLKPAKPSKSKRRVRHDREKLDDLSAAGRRADWNKP